MSYQHDTKTLVDLMMLYNAIFFSDLCTKEAVGFYTLGRKLNEVKVEKVSIFNEFPKPFSLRCSSLHVCNSLTCLGLYVVRERERKKDPPCFVESCLCVQLLVDLVTCNPDFEVSSGDSVIK